MRRMPCTALAAALLATALLAACEPTRKSPPPAPAPKTSASGAG